tara:strand:- start:2746 stop:3033 length:288 start_codon:yes stop_codon:yes gene_type:complete
MSSVDLDEDLKSDIIYDDNQRLIKDDLGNKFKYEVVDDDYRPEKERVYQRLSGEQTVALIQLSQHLPEHYIRRMRAYMMRGKTLEEANTLIKRNY